jgi:hypothetical protein
VEAGMSGIQTGDLVRVRPPAGYENHPGYYRGDGVVQRVESRQVDGRRPQVWVFVTGTWDEHEGEETWPFEQERVELIESYEYPTLTRETAPQVAEEIEEARKRYGLMREADDIVDGCQGACGSCACGSDFVSISPEAQAAYEAWYKDSQGGESQASEPVQTLPVDSQERKDTPVCSGVFDYFPAALAEVARVSKAGNDKHNPGEPLHWARGKSMDQADALARHLLDRGGFDPDTGLRHTAELAWRALAMLQLELEEAGAPMARGASEA